jgi:hypothetical protein
MATGEALPKSMDYVDTFDAAMERLPYQVSIASSIHELAVYALGKSTSYLGGTWYEAMSWPIAVRAHYDRKPEKDHSSADLLRAVTAYQRGYIVSISTNIRGSMSEPEPLPGSDYRGPTIHMWSISCSASGFLQWAYDPSQMPAEFSAAFPQHQGQGHLYSDDHNPYDLNIAQLRAVDTYVSAARQAIMGMEENPR